MAQATTDAIEGVIRCDEPEFACRRLDESVIIEQ
jgi:hypothetical protein